MVFRSCCCCLLHPQEIRALDTSTSSPLGGTKMDWSCWLCLAPLLCVPRLRYTVHDEAGKPEQAVDGTKLKVKMQDKLWDAVVTCDSPYDPKNEVIRKDA